MTDDEIDELTALMCRIRACASGGFEDAKFCRKLDGQADAEDAAAAELNELREVARIARDLCICTPIDALHNDALHRLSELSRALHRMGMLEERDTVLYRLSAKAKETDNG